MEETICGFNVSESARLVPANELFDCEEDFPADLMSWDLREMNPSITTYYLFMGYVGWPISILNLSIIVGVMRSKPLRKQDHNWQVVGQALSDFVIGALSVWFFWTPTVNGWYVSGEQLGCGIFAYIIVGTCNTTLFSLAWIALNRKRQILDNRKAPFRKMAMEYIFGVWGFTFLLLLYYPLVSTTLLLSGIWGVTNL